MKVLLAWRAPDEAAADPWALTVPAGLLWMAASLRASGHEASVANFSRLAWKGVQQFLAEARPGLVGVSCSTANRGVAVRLVRLARRACPEAVIVLGGPHAGGLAPALLRRVREVDAVVVGEGEAALVQVARLAAEAGRAARLGDVPGVVVRQHDPMPPRPPDVDRLPRPVVGLQGAGLVPDRDLRHVVASRARESGIARRAPSSVALEMGELREHFGVIDVSLVGPGLLASPAWLSELADGLAERRTSASFDVGASLEDLVHDPRDPGVEAALFDAFGAGCRSVRLEVHSDQAATLSRDALAEASRVLRAAGLSADLTVRLGAVEPEDAGEVLDDLRSVVRALRPASGRIEADQLLPGTELWAQLSAEREVDDALWFDDERIAVPLAPPSLIERAEAALEPVMRDVARTARPGARDLDALESRRPTAWTHLAWAAFRTAHGDSEEAERRLRAAIALEPASAFPWLRLAALFRRGKGDPRREAAALRQVLERVPHHAATRERLEALEPRPPLRRKARARPARG